MLSSYGYTSMKRYFTIAAFHVRSTPSNSRRITVTLSSGVERTLTSEWIIDNCNETREPTTNQKIRNAGFDAVRDLTITKVVTYNKTLSVEFSDNTQSTIDLNWLQQTLESTSSSNFDPLTTALRSTDEIPRISYDKVMDPTDEGLYEWTTALANNGLCIIEDAPIENDIVTKTAGRIAPPINTLYGSIFDVRTEKNPINIAYTNAKLRHHQDLAYYESPPGLQFLHCLAFDDSIVGGNSTFIDTFVLADILKTNYPKEFEILQKIPATFQKDHVNREHPAQFFYRRPHITTNATNEVTQVFWSPAFEGPLHMDSEIAESLGYASEGDAVDSYYTAYRTFASLLMDENVLKEWEINLRVKKGEILTFNQRRLLHGREQFNGNGERHFQGCYVGEGDFLSRHRVLHLNHGNGTRGRESVYRTGNGCYR
jgi:alpha-ketoglutarate-dependent taurine dioxygenase